MTKGIVTIAALLLLPMSVMSAPVFGPFTGSFRYTVSGGLLWGDFDNDLDPIYIWDNDGYRVYTTLSNLSSNNNRHFENSGDGTYLFGASGNFGIPSKFPWESRTAFIVQLADTRTPQQSGLDLDFDGNVFGGNDQSGFGDMGGSRADFWGWNAGNNQFDWRDDFTAKANNFDVFRNRDWHLTHSFTDGSKRFGISITHLAYGYNSYERNRHSGNFSFEFPDQSFSFSSTMRRTSLVGSIDTLWSTGSRSGDFSTKYEDPANRIAASYEMPFGLVSNSEIRFDLFYETTTNKTTTSDTYIRSGEIFSFPAVANRSSATERYTLDAKADGSMFSPGVQLTKHWDPATYSWFRLDVSTGSRDGNWATVHTYDTSGVLDLRVADYNYNSSTTITGDISTKMFRFFHKTVAELSPKLTVTAGFDFMVIKDEGDNLSYTTSTTISDDDVDDAFDVITDTRRDYSRVETGVATSKDVDRYFTLPVAMEYTLKKWTFRLGAVHTISSYISDTSFTQTALPSFSDTTFRGDNSTVVGTPPGEYASFSQKTTSKSHWNQFYYGLLLRATDNLTIELMDFMDSQADFNDSEFFQELRLSFTLLL